MMLVTGPREPLVMSASVAAFSVTVGIVVEAS
jgi:hypothetical protein